MVSARILTYAGKCGVPLDEKSVNIRGKKKKLYCKSHVIYQKGIQVSGKMKKNGGGTDNPFGPPVGERVLWDTNSPDHECDCPGPPPQFYLPPPPRPSSLMDSICSEHSVPHLETCEAVPVIDSEYHYIPAVPSFAVILTVAIVVVVFLLFGTFLVALKKRKIQTLFSRKSTPLSRCDGGTTNGVTHEDLINGSPLCPPGQTTLPSIEMIDVVSYPECTMFTPVFICSQSPVPESGNSQELFNPVYEELSNGSEERGETDSEGMLQGAASEDEFAEDELSLGGQPDISLGLSGQQMYGSPQETIGSVAVKDFDFSDADDKSEFLKNCGKNMSLPSDLREKGKKTSRGPFVVRGTFNKPKSFEKKKLWRKRGSPTSPAPSMVCDELHESFLLKKILQIYPDVTGVGTQYSRRPPSLTTLEDQPPAEGRYESLAAFGQPPSCLFKPTFSAFGVTQSSAKNQSQDSSLGEKSFSRTRKAYRLQNKSDPVLS